MLFSVSSGLEHLSKICSACPNTTPSLHELGWWDKKSKYNCWLDGLMNMFVSSFFSSIMICRSKNSNILVENSYLNLITPGNREFSQHTKVSHSCLFPSNSIKTPYIKRFQSNTLSNNSKSDLNAVFSNFPCLDRHMGGLILCQYQPPPICW